MADFRPKSLSPQGGQAAPDWRTTGVETGPLPGAAHPAKLLPDKTRQASVERDTRNAVLAARGSGEYVRLAKIRDALQAKGYSREEQDAALAGLFTQPDVQIIPIANLKSLSPDDRRAGVLIGGEQQHAIRINAGGTPTASAPPRSRASIRRLEERTLTNLERLTSRDTKPTAERLRSAMPDMSAADLDFALGQLRKKGFLGDGDRLTVTELGRNRLSEPQAFRQPRRQFPRRGNVVPRGTSPQHRLAVKDRVRAAYEARPKAPGGWVGLADLRADLPDLSREDVDAALKALARERGVRVAPFDNTRALRPQDKAAALELGDSPKHMIAIERRAREAAGHDATPGHDELHHYWTRNPEGRSKWVDSPKPWTTLVALLTEHVGPLKAKVFASRWFIETFGYAAGSDKNRVAHGHPPRGHLVGPG